MADDLERRLEALGSVEPAPLDQARLAAMTDRVMAATATPNEPGRRGLLLAVAAGLIALLVAGIALTAALGGDDALRLDVAEGVTLEFPDTAPATGSRGDELPDGTVVTVAEGGSATIDGRRLGPGRYLVLDGRIVGLADESSTTTSVTTTPRSTTTRPSSTTSSTTTTVVDGEDTPVVPVPGTTVPPPVRTTTTTAVDRPPVDDTRPDRTTTTTTNPTSTRPDRPSTTVRDRPATTTTVRDRPPTTVPTTTRATTTTVRDRPPDDRP